MKLVIIQGAPATGKTELARRLSKDLKLNYFFKDDYKEAQFELLDKIPSLVEWKRIEQMSWKKLYDAITDAKSKDESLIVEGNLMSKQRTVVGKLVDEKDHVVEVFCITRGLKSFKRYRKRYKQGRRLKGHRDNLWYPVVFANIVLSKLGVRIHKPMNLSEHTLIVDTTDFEKVDYNEINRYVKNIVN